MALFKVFRGSSINLPSTIHDGYAYLTTDDGKFYIDTSTRRILINPDTSSADKISYLRDGILTNVAATLDDILASSASAQIHTSQEWAGEYGSQISSKGTIYVYSDAAIDKEGNQIPRVKIGDGMAYINDLPFIDTSIWEEIFDHINNTEMHTTLEEKRRWNNKLNVNDAQELIGASLVFNRN